MDNNIYFNKANVVVNDWWVVVGDKQYEISTIQSTEVAAKQYPLDWWKFAAEQLLGLAIITGITVVPMLFGLNLLSLYVYWAMRIAIDAYQFKRKGTRHSLILHTLTSAVVVSTLDDGDSTYLHVVAKEINKRISRNALTSLVQQAGVQTTRVVAD